MKVINLTLPLYPFMPVGNVWAWDSPFQLTPLMTPNSHGVSAYHMSFHSETGTRLMLAACYEDDAPKIHELDYRPLVNRPTVVIDIPKRAAEPILPEDIAAALRASGSWERSALIVATGWGDEKRWESLGEDYSTSSPHFAPAAAERLSVEMEERGSDVLLTDCAHLDRPGGEFARKEWLELVPWLRPPWPSDQAKAYLRHYTPEKVQADWSASLALTRNTSVVVGLANCGALSGPSVRLTILPMSIANVAEAPCTVVAEPGD
jgi:kynurenine formamidase